MSNLRTRAYSNNFKIGISLIVVAVLAVASIVTAALVLPTIAPIAEPEVPEIAAIVADNEGIIGVNADLTKVFATIKYVNGTEEKKALSELIVSGLDTSSPTTLQNVMLDFGGFKQSVKYEVVPTLLEIEYVASTGGRVEGDSLQNVPAGTDATRVLAVPDEGYRFVKWSDDYPNASRVDTKVSASNKLVAIFEKKRFIVVFFYPDGTTAREEKVAYGESASKVPRADEHNMKLYGYKFIGFDKDYTIIAEHTDIYPLYEKYATDTYVEYTLDAEGMPLGTSDAIPYYQKGEPANLRVEANPSRLFVGWSIMTVDKIWVNLQPTNERRLIKVGIDHNIEFKTSRTGTSEEYVLSFTPDEFVEELYIKVHFVFIESQVAFTSMGRVLDNVNILHNEVIGQHFDVEDLTVFSEGGYFSEYNELGYEFKGWAEEGGELDEFGKPIIIDNNHTFPQPTKLVAQWERRVCEVIFLRGDSENTDFLSEANGYDPAKGGKVSKIYFQATLGGKDITGRDAFPTEDMLYTHHTFKGWYLLGEDMLPTNIPVDKTYKVDALVTYVVPVFEINKVKLNIEIQEGAGTIKNLRPDPENPLNQEEVAISGIFLMEVNKEHKFRVRASAGYKILGITVGGLPLTIYSGLEEYDFTISSPSTDRDVSLRFGVTNFEVTINNGSVGSSQGIIFYNQIDENEDDPQGEEGGGVISSDALIVQFDASYGSNKNVEILSEDGYYISSVVVNGVGKVLPSLATYYTTTLSNITSNVVINVVYRDFRFKITLPDELEIENGSVIPLEPQIDYAKNSNPRVEISADNGYYIKSIKANGWIVEPYQPLSGYSTSSIEILGVSADAEDRDPRVTHCILTVDGIEADVAIEVVFAVVYYNVIVTIEGIGTADKNRQVLHGHNIDVQANTSVGYYIAAVEVDGVQEKLVGLHTSMVHTLFNVEKDYDIKFVFAPRRKAVTFSPNSEIEVTYKSTKYSLTLGKTFEGINIGDNATFTITAKIGSQIESIQYYSSENPVIQEEIIAFSATSHVLQLDSIEEDYVVTAFSRPLFSQYSIYVSNKKGSVLFANGNILDFSEYSSTLVQGTNLTIEVEPGIGQDFSSIENVLVVNKDLFNPYSYTRKNERDQNLTEGQYFIDESGVKIYLIVENVGSDIDVFVTISDYNPSYDIHLSPTTNGTLTATIPGNETPIAVDDSTEVGEGTKVTFTMTPAPTYTLLALFINGERVQTGIVADEEKFIYIATMGQEPLCVSAIFEKNRYRVSIDRTDSNGSVTASVSVFSAGEPFDIKITARKGYTINSFSITVGTPGINYPINVGKNTGVLVYTLPLEYATADISIQVTFEANSFSLKLGKEGNGEIANHELGEKDVKYGDPFSVKLQASENHFIYSITFNGRSISPFDLYDKVESMEIEGVEEGVFNFVITETSEFYVVFKPNQYLINLVPESNGTSLFKKVSDGVASKFVESTSLYCNAGDELWIKMTAEAGCHIAKLFINGEEDSAWKSKGTRDNELTEVYYKLVSAITGNVRVQVIYEVNLYSIKVNASNISLNFKDYDSTPQDYGRVSIIGYLPNEGNEYTGFAHGTSVKLFLEPRTTRGYYVHYLYLRFADGGERVIGDLENGGTYIIYDLHTDIDEVRVEFRRRLFTFDLQYLANQQGSTFPWQGRVEVKFSNPYNTSVNIVKVDGEHYEYGTIFEVTLSPGTGYTRTGFFFNNEDRSSFVKGDKYVGIVTSNILGEAEFTINTYTVSAEQTAGGKVKFYDDISNLLWVQGIQILEPGDSTPQTGDYVNSEVTTSSGFIWVYEDRVVATYGTHIRISAIPNNALNGVVGQGYSVSSFTVNRVPIGVYEDVAATVEYSLKEDLNAVCGFRVNRYNVEVLPFEGGNASVTVGEVIWSEHSTINFTAVKGYNISWVTINGIESEEMKANLALLSSHTIINITEAKIIEIRMERKRYDVIFDPESDYNASFSINEGEKILTAKAKVGLNENVPNRVSHVFSTEDGSILPNGYIQTVALDGSYIGLRYADKLVLYLTVPDGHQIFVISIKMDDEGVFEREIVSSEAGLDVDDGSGVRTYTLSNVTGNIKIYVEYKIKTYSVSYMTTPNGQFESTSISSVLHHEKITWILLADYGYYLSQLDINGIQYKVSSNTLTYSKQLTSSGEIYRYSTDTRDHLAELIQKEINNTLLNGSNFIRITPYFSPLQFNVHILINNSALNENLKVTVHNNKIIYDPHLKIVFNHAMDPGYSIKSIVFTNSDGYNPRTYALESTEGQILENGQFNPKHASLSLNAYGEIIDILDYHSANESMLRASYLVEIDKHLCDFVFHLIEGELVDGVYINKGTSFSDDGMIPFIDETTPAFSISREFSDYIPPSSYHEYGVYGVYNVLVNPLAQTKYEFSGFQEKVNNEWSYVTSQTPNIELLSNGRTLKVHLVGDRQFRAVFFRLYTVIVEVHPEFKYVQGSFATSEPSLMNYRLYASLSASAQHHDNLENDVVLPNIPNPYVNLVDMNHEPLDGKYEFLVRSGANLSIGTIDTNATVNPSRTYVYYDVQKTPSSYSQGVGSVDYQRGVQILRDKTVYCYAGNNVYLSFAMETEGAQQANAGGTVTYHVNGAVSALVNNSLIISPNSTVEVTIKPNANYRFDNISSLQYAAKGSEDGYRRSLGVFSPLVSTLDGQVQVEYYSDANLQVPITYAGRIATVKVYMKNVGENSIFKIKFWKQIEFSRIVTVMTDEGLQNSAVNLRPTFVPAQTNPEGTYDYGDKVSLLLNLNSSYTGWDIRWQFVGFILNGVNLFKNLNQAYPTELQLELTLDNSAYIQEKYVGGKLVFAVDVVARFVPVYNVVVENEYIYPLEEEDDIYLNQEYITYSVVSYRSESMKYTKDNGIIEAKGGEDDHNEFAFKMLGKINTTTGSKELPTSGYNTWVNNEITLNWAGSALAGPTYKFLGWQYYSYDTNTQSYSWANIPYVKELGGSQGTMDYKRPQYTFPISSLVSSSYFNLFKTDGSIDLGAAKATVWEYDSQSEEWVETQVPAIRIRPRFQKIVPAEILKEAASEEENVYTVQGAANIKPVFVENSLTFANFNYYTTVNLDPAIRTGYTFDGWFLVVNGEYIKLEDAGELAKKQVGSTDVYMSYMFLPNNNRLRVRLDWLEGSYSIVARYTRIFTITIEVVSASGNSPYITNSLPKISFYGQATKQGATWLDPQAPIMQSQRKVIWTTKVGNRLVFKLDTGYDANTPNDWTKFSPRFDKLEGIEALELNLDIDMWPTGDLQISSGILLGGVENYASDADYVEGLESAVYRIAANGDKYVKIFIRAEADLIIHNVYCNSFIRLPDALAVSMGMKEAGSTEKIYIKDNGPEDKDNTLGIIRLENIPIKPGVNYDGVLIGDFGNRLSPFLTNNSVLSTEIYQRGINLDGNTLTSKLAQFVYYGEKNVLTGYNLEGSPIYTSLSSPISEYPFHGGDTSDAGDGSVGKPFLISTIGQLKNIDLLYEGNIIDNYPTLRYFSGNQTYRLYFKLVANIDLNQDDQKLSTPLCSNGNGFDGILLGKIDSVTNYCLYDLYISSPRGDYAGLFAKIANGGEVQDIDLGSFHVSGGASYVGAIAGYVSDNSRITNVKTNDSAVFNPGSRNCNGLYYVGGIAGYVTRGSIINACSLSNNTVTTAFQTPLDGADKVATYNSGGAGGIVGCLGSEILTGGSRARILACSVNKTTLNGKYSLGGIVGGILSSQTSSTMSVVDGCHATDVQLEEGEGAIGGVVGFIGLNGLVDNLSLQASTRDISIKSKWSTTAYTTPTEPVCFQYGGGGIAGINFGVISLSNVQGGQFKIYLDGSISGGIVGVNSGTITETTTTTPFRVDILSAGGNVIRSGAFGGQVGYNRASGIIEGAVSIYKPGNYATPYAENSALITVHREGGGIQWNDVYDIEIPNEQRDPPAITGWNPGSDSSNLYLGGIVGYNRGNIYSKTHYDDDDHKVIDKRTKVEGKLIASRRSNGEATNRSYIGLIVGYNDTNFNVSDTYADIQGKIEYYRYNYVGYFAFNKDIPYIYMEDYLGGTYGWKSGTGQVVVPSDPKIMEIHARYEANGAGMSDHTPSSGRWGGYTQASDFPLSRIILYSRNYTNKTVENPINVSLEPLANVYNHAYLGPNVHREGSPGIYCYDYYGKYRQTILTEY